MAKIIDFNDRKPEEAIVEDGIDIHFLTWLIMNGSTSYELVDVLFKSKNFKELTLENGMTIKRDKINNLYISFTEDGELCELGLGLFLAISKAKRDWK